MRKTVIIFFYLLRCASDGLKHAKTIDLCNNPLTKEAKLTAAQRIVPEWKGYDDEIKSLMNRIDDEQHPEQTTSRSSSGEKIKRKFNSSILTFLAFR